MNSSPTTKRKHDTIKLKGNECCFLSLTSFSAAGIFFCFLVKEKAPGLIGETDVEAQRSPKKTNVLPSIHNVRGHVVIFSVFM